MTKGVRILTALVVVALVAGSCASLTKKEEWTGRRIDEAIALDVCRAKGRHHHRVEPEPEPSRVTMLPRRYLGLGSRA